MTTKVWKQTLEAHVFAYAWEFWDQPYTAEVKVRKLTGIEHTLQLKKGDKVEITLRKVKK